MPNTVRTVVGLLVLAVLHKPSRQDIRLESLPGDEMVVHAGHLALSASSGCVWRIDKGTKEARLVIYDTNILRIGDGDGGVVGRGPS